MRTLTAANIHTHVHKSQY